MLPHMFHVKWYKDAPPSPSLMHPIQIPVRCGNESLKSTFIPLMKKVLISSGDNLWLLIGCSSLLHNG